MSPFGAYIRGRASRIQIRRSEPPVPIWCPAGDWTRPGLFLVLMPFSPSWAYFGISSHKRPSNSRPAFFLPTFVQPAQGFHVASVQVILEMLLIFATNLPAG